MEEKWWVFIIIGLIIGAVLGYYFGSQSEDVVGRRPMQCLSGYNGCVRGCNYGFAGEPCIGWCLDGYNDCVG